MKKILAALFVFVAGSCFALEIVTLDGQAFHDCEVKKVEREGVRIMHRDGTAFLDFDVLPSALQKQYGWTAEKSAARKAERTAAADAQRIAGENARRAQEEMAAATARATAELKEKYRAEEARQAEAKIAEEARQAEARESERSRAKLAQWAGLALGLLIGLPIYFLPSIIGRKKANAGAIFAMNLFLGWVFIGWVIALIWACTKDVEPHRVTVVQNVLVQHPPQMQPVPRPIAIARPVPKAIQPPRNPPSPPPA